MSANAASAHAVGGTCSSRRSPVEKRSPRERPEAGGLPRGCFAFDREERGHEGVGVEVAQVGRFLAEADEEHGHAHRALDGEGHAALGRAVELGEQVARWPSVPRTR